MATKRNIEEVVRGDNDDGDRCKDKKKAKISESSSASEEDNGKPTVIKCKTVFKKRIVERALEREEERDSDDDQSDQPIIKYYVKYSVKKDLLSVGGVEVIADETEKVLRCSQCPYVTKVKWEKEKRTNGELRNMECGIRNHVIGQHLGGFPCDKCRPVPMFHQSLSAHQKHLMEVHNERYKQLEAKVKASFVGKAARGTTIEEESSSEEEEYWPDGQRRMRRQYKCSFPNCGKRFHKVTRWQRHEQSVHAVVTPKETPVEKKKII